MSLSEAWDLFVQKKAQDKFQRTFCLSWKEALDQEYDKLEKGETMLRFRGGFHCRNIEGGSLSKASTRAYVSSSPWNADNSIGRSGKVFRVWHGHLLSAVRVECG